MKLLTADYEAWIANPLTKALKQSHRASLVEKRTWVGLTDKEIKSLPSWWPSYEDAPALVQLIKDVEVKLKEKNGG